MNPLIDVRMWRRVLCRVWGFALLVFGLSLLLVATLTIWERLTGNVQVASMKLLGVTLVGWHITAFYGVVALLAICAVGLAVSFVFHRSDADSIGICN